MPYRSKKQRDYLRRNKPEVAKKFEQHSGSKIVPKKKSKKRKKG